jgi:hypothetical protein
MRRLTILLAATLLIAAPAAAADTKKSLSGPVEIEAESVFPTYHTLGAGIYVTTLDWSQVALLKPVRARDADDPSYDWPAEIDEALDEARANRMKVAVTITGAPEWANGGHPARYAPKNSADYGDFAVAAARRYPGAHLWIAWQDPSSAKQLTPNSPARYAPLLDAAYGALKSVSKQNVVVGGGSSGNAKSWLKRLKLSSGKRPRLDLYAHNVGTSVKGLGQLNGRVRKAFSSHPKLFLTDYTTNSPTQLKATLKQVDKAAFVYSLQMDFARLANPDDGTHTKLFTPYKNN